MKFLVALSFALATLWPTQALAAAEPAAGCPRSGTGSGYKWVQSFNTEAECCSAGRKAFKTYYCQNVDYSFHFLGFDMFRPTALYKLYAKR